MRMSELPNIDKLVSCGGALADELEMVSPSLEVLKNKIDEILFVRENYENAKLGLITNRELVNIMMAHIQTLVCKTSGNDEPSELKLSEQLSSDFHSALFG
jgi:hypothetical protein